MIAIHTNAPMMPLTQMIGDDAVIGFAFESSDVLTVMTEDEVAAHWIAKTLDILGYQVEMVTQTEV